MSFMKRVKRFGKWISNKIGSLKQKMDDVSEYRKLQQELTKVLAPSGINFWYLHPEITKFLVAAAREEGAETAVATLKEIIEKIATQFPGLTQDQAQEQLLRILKRFAAGLQCFAADIFDLVGQ